MKRARAVTLGSANLPTLGSTAPKIAIGMTSSIRWLIVVTNVQWPYSLASQAPTYQALEDVVYSRHPRSPTASRTPARAGLPAGSMAGSMRTVHTQKSEKVTF